MTMKKKLALLLCMALCACVLSSCALLPLGGISSMLPRSGGTGNAASQATAAPASSGNTVTISREQYERYKQFDGLLDIMDNIDKYYLFDDADHETLLQGAATGMLDAVEDPYTFYYTPDEFSKMWEDDNGNYVGIGVQISANYTTQICTITRVFAGGPADKAGVMKGDILYRVNEDLYVTADNLDEAVSIMRGVEGTDVTVTFLRGGEPYEVTMTRAAVVSTRVDSMMLDNQIGYIYLYEFAGDCTKEFMAALDRLVDEGAKGIMIDLRDNGGGWVQDARAIADFFLPSGVVCYLEDKAGNREYYRTFTDGSEVELPLVILVNQYTASSSEILTGCLRDRANCKVVGVKSYGKGIVQGVINLNNGAGMQVTEAQYFTPNGNAVHKLGITPDVIVEMPEDAKTLYLFGDMEDVQLKTAYDTMMEMLK